LHANAMRVSWRPLWLRLEQLIASPVLWWFFLACALALRFRQYLFASSYWYDESFLILTIRERDFPQLLGAQPYNLVIPPVFLWLTRGLYVLGGDGELLLRLPAFVAGLLALLLMIPLSRRVVGGPQALWPFALLAVARNVVAHGCEVRPYTFDLLFTELIVLWTAIIIDPAVSSRTRKWSCFGLGVVALIGPWLSFPSAFVLGGASAALACHLGRHASRAAWGAWLALNALVGLGGLGLWWLSARCMYYPGMLEHWGQHGWKGFPDWYSPGNICCWLLWRPGEIGNYGNRELGIVLAVLALVGGWALAKRARPLLVLLTVPFVLAVASALLGKYPLAHRTTVFLLPCLWLLAGVGIADLVEKARRHGWALASAGLLLVAWDFSWLVVSLVTANPGVDYRGAYQYVHAHQQPGDALWAHMAVVYQTYYGKDAPGLTAADLSTAEQIVSHQRLWAVVGSNRIDLRRQLESAGGQVVFAHDVEGLSVLLFEPGKE
jgi:hypothetical protein